jgi:hypothetical protein
MLIHTVLNFYKKVPPKEAISCKWVIWCPLLQPTLSLILLKRKKHMVLTILFHGWMCIDHHYHSQPYWVLPCHGWMSIDWPVCMYWWEPCIAQSLVHVKISSDMQALRRNAQKYSRRACSRKSPTGMHRNNCLLDQLDQVFSTQNHVPIASYA